MFLVFYNNKIIPLLWDNGGIPEQKTLYQFYISHHFTGEMW